MRRQFRVIISGGGTGGHIFPALSIADAIKSKYPDSEILFVGANNRMEMQRVPEAGYKIIGLPITGFDRKHIWKNIKVLWMLFKSHIKTKKIIKEFAPQVVVGVGGFASGPTLKRAQQMNIPTLIQEQNSYAGVTNKLLAKKAKTICVAYEGMEKFFPKEKLKITGNPVRKKLLENITTPKQGKQNLGLDPEKKTILILGGSLGAGSINESVMTHLRFIQQNSDIEFLWQTGKYYIDDVRERLEKSVKPENLHVTDFVSDMGSAYAAAELVVSRAGAGSISEFAVLGKAVLLVPSPNVAEDHQTKNAMALVNSNAAIFVSDAHAGESLIETAIKSIKNEELLHTLSENIIKFGKSCATEDIAEEVYHLAESFCEKEKRRKTEKIK